MKALYILRHLAIEQMKKKHPAYPDNLRLPVKTFTDKTANGLTQCIIKFLELKGHFAERINSMGVPVDRRRTFVDVVGFQRTIGSVEWRPSGCTPGTADIAVSLKGGKSLKIEVKCKATGDNNQSHAQKDYQKSIEATGGIYYIARDFQSFYDWYCENIELKGGQR